MENKIFSQKQMLKEFYAKTGIFYPYVCRKLKQT